MKVHFEKPHKDMKESICILQFLPTKRFFMVSFICFMWIMTSLLFCNDKSVNAVGCSNTLLFEAIHYTSSPLLNLTSIQSIHNSSMNNFLLLSFFFFLHFLSFLSPWNVAFLIFGVHQHSAVLQIWTWTWLWWISCVLHGALIWLFLAMCFDFVLMSMRLLWCDWN